MLRIATFVKPTRFRYALSRLKRGNIKILDIGCGNNSPSVTKHWFPSSTYHAADIQEYNLSKVDKPCIDRFFPVTVDYQGYDAIENYSYDFVIVNHVLEHTDNPARLAGIAATKVRPDGILWIAYPSFHSLSLPRGFDGVCTNSFCDDPTHISVVDSIAVCTALVRSGIRIAAAGPSHDPIRMLLGLFLLPMNFIRLIVRGRVGRGLWYVMGFEDRIIGIRNAIESAPPVKQSSRWLA